MDEDDDTRFLDGRLLIAMPGMGDPRFSRAVIYLCVHSADGAMGLIVNKPAPELKVAELLRQLDIAAGEGCGDGRVHFGGPVSTGQGFVLHSADYAVEGSSLKVDAAFAMTGTVEVLQDIARGKGPTRSILALGYSGWGRGQLEAEIQANAWLVAPADPDIVFGLRDAEKWEAALRKLSIDPRLLSAEGGRA
jgi:putative transcriptional regulator